MSNDKDFKDFLLHIANEKNGGLIKELFERWEQFKQEQLSKRDWVVFTESVYGFKTTWFAFDWGHKFDSHDEYGGVKVFETKEEAEEYILLNRPMLSLNDVKSCINYQPPAPDSNPFKKWLNELAVLRFDDLKKLAKSKMDGK